MDQPELPDYASPPVREVAVSVQVAPLAATLVTHTGRVWDRLRDEYPNVEVHPPLPPLYASTQRPAFHFDFGGPPTVRTWFANAQGTELIQLQLNRVAFNWRGDPYSVDEKYPRWQHIRTRFTDAYSLVDGYTSDNGLGALNPETVEVTYHNVWTLADDGMLDLLLAPLDSMWPPTGSPTGMSVSRLSLTAPIEHGAGGALVIECGVTPDRTMHLQLVATIELGQERTLSAVLAAIDHGRSTIVRSFTGLTTPYAHKLWERTR